MYVRYVAIIGGSFSSRLLNGNSCRESKQRPPSWLISPLEQANGRWIQGKVDVTSFGCCCIILYTAVEGATAPRTSLPGHHYHECYSSRQSRLALSTVQFCGAGTTWSVQQFLSHIYSIKPTCLPHGLVATAKWMRPILSNLGGIPKAILWDHIKVLRLDPS